MALRDTGGNAALYQLFAELESKIGELMPAVAEEVAAQVALRAPSPEEERQTMMFGGNNMGGASDDDSDGRLRFIKAPQDYLQPTILRSFAAFGLNAGIGNILELDRVSQYRYVNKNHPEEHLVTIPFWQAFEYGGGFIVRPKFESTQKGRGYPLRPTPDSFAWQMTKVIPPHMMFYGINSEHVFDTVLIPKVREIIGSL